MNASVQTHSYVSNPPKPWTGKRVDITEKVEPRIAFSSKKDIGLKKGKVTDKRIRRSWPWRRNRRRDPEENTPSVNIFILEAT